MSTGRGKGRCFPKKILLKCKSKTLKSITRTTRDTHSSNIIGKWILFIGTTPKVSVGGMFKVGAGNNMKCSGSN
jgi:hypothetical protein